MQRLVRLQGLRALAASAVVLGHAWAMLIARGALPADQIPLTWIAGQIGVTVFFVISGLIMTRAHADAFAQPGAPGAFLARRLIRIAPMYWLATLLIVGVQWAHHAPPVPADLLRSILFIPYRAEGAAAVRPVLGLGWTLNCEAIFYVVFGLALLLPRRLGLLAVLGGLTGITLLGGFVRPLLPYADPTTGLAFATDPILLRFGAGVLIGWAEISGRAPAPRTPAPLLFSAAMLAGVGVLFWRMGGAFPLSYAWQAGLTATAAFAVWLCTATAPGESRSATGRLVEAAGDASYSTYLFQTFAAQAALAAGGLAPPGWRPAWALLALAVVAANLLGWIVFTLVERPMTRRLRSVLGQSSPDEWRVPAS